MLEVGSVVIDCNDFQVMYEFWREALGYQPKYPPEPDWVILTDPQRNNVNVSIGTVPEPRVGKNRLHLDLYTTDPKEEIRRLLDLGARLFPRDPEPDEDFTVLQDPEGNLFCVVDTGMSP